MNSGDRIKQLRLQKGYTLEELGQLVGVGKSTVRKWETGAIANMRRDKIARLAAALGTSVNDIMGLDDVSVSVLPPLYFDPLSSDERQLVEDYRELTPSGREYIRQTMALAKNAYSPAPEIRLAARGDRIDRLSGAPDPEEIESAISETLSENE